MGTVSFLRGSDSKNVYMKTHPKLLRCKDMTFELV